MKRKLTNLGKLALLTALLGACAGLIIWCFLKAVGLCAGLVWDWLPAKTGAAWLTVLLCAAGGLVVGHLHRTFGVYPEELPVVMQKIRRDKRYEYHPMLVMLASAFFPLALGASVGPEAGLTGIIAALCSWVGDNVKFAKRNAELFSQIGEAVTLGQLFHSPLFGILAVEEDPSEEQALIPQLSKGNKLVFYGISAAASFLVVEVLNALFGQGMGGFPSFSDGAMGKADFALLLLYIPVGLLVYVLYVCCERLTGSVAQRVPAVLRETLCGVAIGLVGLTVPLVLFSGEEQMGEMMETFSAYSPFLLIGVCLLKLLMTTFCIRFGLKGGHFFPLIFACVCMGIGLVSLLFADPSVHGAFAAAAVTATVLGAQIKKPLAVSLLLLLCFPAKLLICIVLCAAVGSRVSLALSRGAGGEKERL